MIPAEGGTGVPGCGTGGNGISGGTSGTPGIAGGEGRGSARWMSGVMIRIARSIAKKKPPEDQGRCFRRLNPAHGKWRQSRPASNRETGEGDAGARCDRPAARRIRTGQAKGSARHQAALSIAAAFSAETARSLSTSSVAASSSKVAVSRDTASAMPSVSAQLAKVPYRAIS